MLVCDASLVVELSLARIEDVRAALGGDQLVAPPLLWSEVPSVLHELVFRGEVSRALSERALKRFLGAKIGIVERRPDGLTMMAWQLASEATGSLRVAWSRCSIALRTSRARSIAPR